MRRQPLDSARPGSKEGVEVELHHPSIARRERGGSCAKVTSLYTGVMSPGAHPFDVDETRRALIARGGGYEVVHSSPGLEIGVYVLVAPEPDRQQPHDEDEVYVVLEGSGVLEVEGTTTPLDGGHGALRPGGRRAPVHGVRAAVPARRLQRPT